MALWSQPCWNCSPTKDLDCGVWVVDCIPTFERLAVFTCNGDLDRMPIIPIVLVGGHYFAVNKVSQKAFFPD